MCQCECSLNYFRARGHFYFTGKLCVRWSKDCPVCWAAQVLHLDAVMRIHQGKISWCKQLTGRERISFYFIEAKLQDELGSPFWTS